MSLMRIRCRFRCFWACCLGLNAGPQCPLSHDFHSAGWRVLQPIDVLIDAAFDATNPAAQQALGEVLRECHLCSAAILH